jgi:ABC-type transporter MlaC component
MSLADYVDYLEDKYGKKLLTYYNDNCNSNKMETTESEFTEYSRTLKNARQQGVGLRFPKSVIKANPARFRPYNR